MKLLKWLDNTFLFFALLSSVPLFLVLFIGYMDMVANVVAVHPTSVVIVNLVIFFSYLYWFVRGLWYWARQRMGNRSAK